MPSPRVRKDLETVTDNIKELRSREKVAKFPHLSDPSYTPISEVFVINNNIILWLFGGGSDYNLFLGYAEDGSI